MATSYAAQPDFSTKIRGFLDRETKLLIDGKWVASTGSGTVDTHDPSTGKHIATLVDATDEDVDRALAAPPRAVAARPLTGLPAAPPAGRSTTAAGPACLPPSASGSS